MARHRRTRTGSGAPVVGIALAAMIGIAFGGAGGATVGYLLRPESNAAIATTESEPAPAPLLSFDELDTDMTVLFMGVDATGDGGRDGLMANSDTMLLMRLAPSEGKIYALSLPRDSRVPIAGHGTFKINAAASWGGPELAANTVATFLDVAIHRYLVVSLQGFIKAIDAIGGVDVTVPKAMNYDDWTGKLHIHLQPGLQRLGGKQAESYLRFRHDEIGSDVARVQRQQGFLMEVGKQLLRPAVILRLPDLWSIVQTHARTNIPPGELIRIARWARHLDIHKDVTMSVLPGDYRTIKGLSYWVPDVDAISPYLDAHFRGRPSGLAGRQTSPRVVIWDATGRHPSLKALQRQLREAGYLVWAVDRRKKSQPATRVIVQRGDAEGGNRLAGTLGMDDVFPAAVGDLNSDFTIELGRDWTGDQAADSRAAAGDGG